VQIRYPKDVQMITSYAMTFSLKTFSTIIDKRLPLKKREYDEWYSSIKGLHQRVASKEQLINIKLD
jgi:hypothetical protein